MTIRILSPQLANQIAAGEVVERPASVVKELVENSLDAGADKIQIDIENGGAGLIRIRDNGIGIAKEELALALARHATSKIADLADLEAILSLGFRGEALASISSVSRLTLTSRTAEQREAWQVYAQGRDMETTIQPASHPVGTTVEVANLFFNTPARRKFLCSEKTEFSHIDEVIRRIALAKFHINFTLTHNGKVLRQYKSAVTHEQKLKRVAAICGEDFIQNALQIDWKHDDLHLSGWVALPQFNRPQNDFNYCYVNGRIVRDKIITHAIRQAYAGYLTADQHPAFVLFIDLNPNEVDVNVHPTKHEVRFQQSRLVHDFITQGISNALASEQMHLPPSPMENAVEEPAGLWETPTYTKPNRSAAGQNIFAPTAGYSATAYAENKSDGTQKHRQNPPHFYRESAHREQITQNVLNAHKTLWTALKTQPQTEISVTEVSKPNADFLHALALINNEALLLQQEQHFYLLSLARLQHLKLELNLTLAPTSQPLLIPIIFRLSDDQWQAWLRQKTFFEQIGFVFTEEATQHKITLQKVSAHLRRQNLQQVIIALLNKPIKNLPEFLTALLASSTFSPVTVLADAVNLLTDTEQLLAKQQQIRFVDLLVEIDWQPYLTQLTQPPR
ncbi:DNA mismatch repair endonuclease MutL [Aggregatibacter actinomycetemcomitans]|uniref:DNA mismatch repair endonuclease MutL n=1 Tax=Aggregatibacter actinomycetemcomitans TaxID=714 RepID=UPI00197B82D3|nr:DNA mismatch repair endonuclease MutL [Aggregatibacter actinomycetemcomitans]MBN6076146.1 DNA mismatch repair endonuclease MutL [Aggregatibacter actinomycetemcomitans]